MKCLVIVDMQEGFMDSNTEHLRGRLKEFLESSNEEGVFEYTVATRYVNHKNTACSIFEGWTGCMEGSGEEILIDEVGELDWVFDKDKYSCYNDEFKNFIKSKGIDELYFCGVNTGCCVLHSVFDSYNDLVSSYVIEDLCGSTTGIQSHNNALQILRECITEERVIKSSDLIKKEDYLQELFLDFLKTFP